MSFGATAIDEWFVSGSGSGSALYRDFAGWQTGPPVDALGPQSRDLYNLHPLYVGQEKPVILGPRTMTTVSAPVLGLPTTQTTVAAEPNEATQTPQVSIQGLTSKDWFWPALVIGVLLVLK